MSGTDSPIAWAWVRSTSSLSCGASASVFGRTPVRVGSCDALPSNAPIAVLIVSLTSDWARPEEHTSELQSLMRISYAVFCLKKKTNIKFVKLTLLTHHTCYNATYFIITDSAVHA